MKNRKLWIRVLSIIIFITSLSPAIGISATNVAADQRDLSIVERIAGANRVETAVAFSRKAYPRQVDTVLLAGYDGGADALTATFMASQLNAPLLVADKYKLSTELLEELERLHPKEIIILGGEAAVSRQIEEGLKEQLYNIRRIKGDSRIDTSIQVAKDHYGESPIAEVFIVEYNSLVDALAIGPVSAQNGAPVLITLKNKIPNQVIHFLQDHDVGKVTIIGGENSVTNETMNELSKYTPTLSRVAGKDRIETSLNIARKYFAHSEHSFIANGWQNTDALIGGYFAAMNNGPIVLINNHQENSDTMNYLSEVGGKSYILGGKTVISEKIKDLIAWQLEDPLKPESEYDQLEAEVLKFTNIARRKENLPALEWDSQLGKVARLKSKDMVENNYFAHHSPVYGSPFDMMKQFGISYTWGAENLALGYTTGESVVRGWMNSSGHRANILNPKLNKIGIGAHANNSQRIYWTQIFTD